MKNHYKRQDLTKNEVFFSDYNIQWCKGCRYVGVHFDDKLTFIDHMWYVYGKIQSNVWLLRNKTNSVMSSKLLLMFYGWIFPHYIYGSPVWIFQCFKVVDFSADSIPNRNYLGPWKKLNSSYIECGKLILGVTGRPSNYAVLARLNWLPLKYVLASQSLTWLYRIIKLQGSEIKEFFTSMRDYPMYDEQWVNSLFFKPAYEMIMRLQNIYNNINNTNLIFLNVENVSRFKELVKISCYYEFLSFWKDSNAGRVTYRFFPTVEYGNHRIINQIHNRYGEKLY